MWLVLFCDIETHLDYLFDNISSSDGYSFPIKILFYIHSLLELLLVRLTGQRLQGIYWHRKSGRDDFSNEHVLFSLLATSEATKDLLRNVQSLLDDTSNQHVFFTGFSSTKSFEDIGWDGQRTFDNIRNHSILLLRRTEGTKHSIWDFHSIFNNRSNTIHFFFTSTTEGSTNLF